MAPHIVPYFPDESGEMYQDYYHSQIGDGLSVYRGKPLMTGNGIGSLFSGLARGVLPMLKKGAKTIGKKLLSTGAGVLSDVISGQSFKASASKRFRDAGGDLLHDVEGVLRSSPAKRARMSKEHSSPTLSITPARQRASKKKRRTKKKTVFD